MAEQESLYEVIKNPDDELLFSIKARSKEPETPSVIYANGQHAVLYRQKDEVVVLDFLPEEAKESLVKLEKVLFVEFDKDEEFVREYFAPVKITKQLPVSI